MCLRCHALLACNEAGANPDGLCAPHQVRSERAAIVDSASSDDVDRLSGKWGVMAPNCIDTSWDEK